MEYLLTIRIPFDAMDDIAARQEAKKILSDTQVTKESDNEIKLQNVFPDKPPRGIIL